MNTENAVDFDGVVVVNETITTEENDLLNNCQSMANNKSKELSKISADFKKTTLSTDVIQEKYIKMLQENIRLSNELTTLRANVIKLMKELTDVTNQLKKFKELKKELSKELIGKKETIDTLKQEKFKLQWENEHLTKDITKLKENPIYKDSRAQENLMQHSPPNSNFRVRINSEPKV